MTGIVAKIVDVFLILTSNVKISKHLPWPGISPVNCQDYPFPIKHGGGHNIADKLLKVTLITSNLA